MLENSIFTILAAFLLFGSLGMISFKQTVFSGLSFLLAMLALAGVFALLHNSFLFLAQILVAVGAVVVVALLVMVSINVRTHNLPKEPKRFLWMLLSAFLVLPFAVFMYKALSHLHRSLAPTDAEYGSLKLMGSTLFSDWVLPFEIVSVLLLVAMVGAILIARKEPANDA